MSMSKRLQVILGENEYSTVRRAAAFERKSISEWVRSLIQQYLLRQKARAKTDVIEAMAKLRLPAPPIDQMLEEIEKGRF